MPIQQMAHFQPAICISNNSNFVSMTSAIKKIALVALWAILTVFSTNAQDATMWMVDKAHTSVNFSINHFFSTVTGKFSKFDGMVHFDPANLKGSRVDFNVEVPSVNTGEEKRDQHLQSNDFFDSGTYPKMSFVSSKFVKKSENEYLVHGKLTIRNTTKDIILPLKVTGEMEHPMMKGNLILGLSTNLKIKRTDYGVGTGNWAATMVVGDDVDVNIHMELNRKKS